MSTYTRYALSRSERNRRQREIRARLEADRRKLESRLMSEAEARSAAELTRAKAAAGLAARMAEVARELTGARAGPPATSRAVETSGRRARDSAERIGAAIESVPEEWRGPLGDGLTEVERALARAAAGGYDAVYLSALEMAEQKLAKLLARAPAMAEEYESASRRASEAAASIEEQMMLVIEGSPLEGERRMASALLEKARGLLSSGDPIAAAAAMARLESDAEALFEDYEETLYRAEEREYVRAQVLDALEEMGYEPMDMRGADTPDERHVSFLEGPGGHSVRLEMGLDEALRCDLLGPPGRESGEDGYDRPPGADRWCSDFTSMLDALRSRDLEVQEYWRSEAEASTEGEVEEEIPPEEREPKRRESR